MRARGRAIPPASDEIRNWLSLAETCRHILLAVSGGPDSVAMMRIVVHWTRTLTGVVPRLSVASVDHGLRPESAGEAEAVSRWAAETGLASAVLRWAGEKPRSGVMAAARDARHRLLSAHADAIGADALMLAHHADDQAETVLMRLAAGSGLTGLAGMAPESRWGALRVLRPFLACPGERLRAALLEDGHPFIADPSNDHPAYARVRLRQARAVLEREGLDQGRITRFADRVRRSQR